MFRAIFAATLLTAFFLTLSIPAAAAEAAAKETIPLRGVVEGFYGKPWTQAERLDQFAFYAQHELNTYIYAPKDDLYHREKWREPYPAAAMGKMQELLTAAAKNRVDFVFALSPGLDIRLGGQAGEADIEALLHKFDSLYAMGVRSFAIFFDDIKNKDGAGQARVLHEVNCRFIKVKPGVKPLITVPTEYFTADMFEAGKLKPYTKAFAGQLDADIIVLYTGPGVVCDGIEAADIAQVNEIYGRKMAVWWNYPVNDYLLPKLALGPITGLDAAAGEAMAGFLMNPMEHAALSKIALATGAAYAADPVNYDEEKSWQQAITDQYGSLAPAMQVFADHSQRMEKRWAHAGRADAPDMRRHMDTVLAKMQAGEDVVFASAVLQADMVSLQQAAADLAAHLLPAVQRECGPQLELARKLAQADATALAMLQAKANGQAYLYKRFRNELLQQKAALPAEKEVKLSEKTARAFIDEALEN